MSYIPDKILDSLIEEDRLILYLIGRLGDAADVIAKREEGEDSAVTWNTIRFLARDLGMHMNQQVQRGIGILGE